MAYTRKMLREDLKGINARLAKVCQYHLVAEGRNGYTGIELYDGKDCVRNVATGSPRKCLESANMRLLAQMEAYVDTLHANGIGLSPASMEG